MLTSIKKILLLFVIGYCIGGNNVFASDNVLQAVQINGVGDSYNIVLKSDDVAEVKKTVQAPNKMILLLKGIRASKTINTIYNNTASIDSVVVEPNGDDTVKILIQGSNVGTSQIQFDSLKTPLGVLGNTASQPKSNGEITLSDPVSSFRPVYNEDESQDESSFSFVGAGAPLISVAKKVMNNQQFSWMITCGLFSILVLSGLKLVKGKDNEIKIGLTQGLKEREIDLYKGSVMANMSNINNIVAPGMAGVGAGNMQSAPQTQRNFSNANYGLKSYQNGSRSPYATPEIQRKPVAMQPQVSPSASQMVRNSAATPKQPIQNMMQNTIQKTQTAQARPSAPKTTNIDSMKFLESMTKIYEKNGRTDLAQGLKANMKKAKAGAV